jgi:glutathione S-transferase
MIKLYGIELSNNVNKVRYVLNYLGLDYELVKISPMEGQTQTEEFKKLSPSGKIPAIDVDGFTLFESNAINRYLAAKNNSDLYPENAEKRAVVEAWTDFAAIHIAGAMTRVLFNKVIAPMMGKDVDENSLKAGLEFLDKFLPIVDKQLGKSANLAGEKISLADINLLAILDPIEMVQVSMEPYVNISKWRTKLQSEAFYQKCYKNYTEFMQTMMSQV